jgi:hypothetical protein
VEGVVEIRSCGGQGVSLSTKGNRITAEQLAEEEKQAQDLTGDEDLRYRSALVK